MSRDITVISGGFDPIHSGHIELLKSANTFVDFVGLNSDEWLTRKKGNYFMTWEERATVLRHFGFTGAIIPFNDSDDSACDLINQVKEKRPDDIIHFHNGGDRNEGNILEALRFANDPQVVFHYGTGGTVKQNSSSDILQRWIDVNKQTTERAWGEYNVLAEYTESKVKTLTVHPGKSLSMQYHHHRSEHWFVVAGEASVTITEQLTSCKGTKTTNTSLRKHELYTIPAGQWHKLSNNTDEELVIVEIQYGDKCEESDIVRKSR